MWNKLDEQKRKLVAMALAILVLCVAYRFSFSHAIEAYQLNSKLKKEVSLQDDDAAYPHLNKKHMFYQKVLTGYEMKKTDVETKLWQTVSNMTVSKQVKISYNPSLLSADTTVNQKIYRQQFGFKGDYFNLLKMLDTLGTTASIGRISNLNVTVPKEASSLRGSDLEMQILLSSIEK